MTKSEQNILSLIGNTPILKLQKIPQNISCEIWVKLEFLNPSGSTKDRIALRMIEEAEKLGKINRETIIIEPTSGNTGIALALVCAVKGYKMIAVMPEAMSSERSQLIKHLGAKVEIVKSCGNVKDGFTKEDIENTLKRALELSAEIPNSFVPNQFENADNPQAHFDSTASEIWHETNGQISGFVASCGTGGTFSGIAKFLKQKNPGIKTAVVEPQKSAVLSGEKPGFHKIQGIGEGFIPAVMDTKLADEIIKIADEDAIKMARRLAKEEGILSGISGGANVEAALKLAQKIDRGIVVTTIPDNAFRYFSAELFE